MTSRGKEVIAELLEVSPRVAKLPRDRRGLPIPYVVLKDEHNTPDFIVNDTKLVYQCIAEGRCSLCGEKMDDEDVWFVGGQMSGLDPRGMYIDPPVHHECGSFALQVCPYLAFGRYKGFKDPEKAKIFQRLISEGRVVGYVDPTVDKNRPESFIFGRVNGYIAIDVGGHIKLLPNRPFAELEEWKDGERIATAKHPSELARFRARGEQMMASRRETLFDLPDLMQAAWTDRFAGEFPWKHG